MMQERDSTILVVGATGTVGGAAARSLLASGARVRALVRSDPDPNDFSGVELVRGDLADAAAVQKALTGVRAAVYVSPHERDEELIGERFVGACERAGVRLVFVGVHIDAPTRVGRALRRFLFGRLLAHYVPKFRIAERARVSSASPVVLMPTNFFQNDEIFRRELLAGSFVQPFERPINRVDVRDIGDAAARACLDASLPPGAYPVVGPESLDGKSCAESWTAELGQRVAYDPDDARFAGAVARELRGKKRDDFLASYAVIRKLAMPTSERDLARTRALLGRAPTSYAKYVHDTVTAWRSADRAPRDASAKSSSMSMPDFNRA
jgi:uncharacterized protein YbjT (DUF2867 family)